MKKINLNTPIGFTGYGVAGLNICKQLTINNYDVSLFPIGNLNVENQQDAALMQNLSSKGDSFDYDATTLKIWHQFDLVNKIGRGKYCAYPFFELDKLKSTEIHHLNFPDQIIVASEWAKNILIDNGITKPITVAPLGVNREIFSPKQELLSEKELNNDNYKFIAVGKWEIRKGYDILCELFNRAFESTDNVELWILASSHESCFSKQELNQWHNYYLSSKLKDKIKIFPRVGSQENVAQIMGNANCGLFLSRAEGWNLELLEMMSIGKPVITTNYSAHTEFVTKENSMLVDIDSVEKAYDGKWFHGFGNWAKIGKKQEEQIIDYMKLAYTEKLNTNDNGIQTANKFSWENTIQKIMEVI